MGNLIELDIPIGYTTAYLYSRLKQAGFPVTLVNLKRLRIINNSSMNLPSHHLCDPLSYLYSIVLEHITSVKDSKNSFLILDKFDLWTSGQEHKEEYKIDKFKRVQNSRNSYIKSIKLSEGVEDKVNKCNINWTYKLLYWIRNSLVYLLKEEFGHNLICWCVYADGFNSRIFYNDLVDAKYSLEELISTESFKNLNLGELKQRPFDVASLRRVSRALNSDSYSDLATRGDRVYDKLNKNVRILNLNVPFEVECESIELARVTLICGPESSGKTTLLKAIAKYWHNKADKKEVLNTVEGEKGGHSGANYVFNLEYYELSSQYVGCAESYLKSIFTKARYNRPALVVFDGIELLFERVKIEEERAIPVTVSNTLLNQLHNLEGVKFLTSTTGNFNISNLSKAFLNMLIKPIGAFLIHSAYINSRGCGYHRIRNYNSNYARSTLFADNSSSAHGEDVFESELPSVLLSRFESPLYSREDKARRILSGDRKNGFPEATESHTKTSYVDEFNSDDILRKGFRPDVDYSRDRDRRYKVHSYNESRLDKSKEESMRTSREYGLKNHFAEEDMMGKHEGNRGRTKYTNDINDIFDREYFETYARQDDKFSSTEYRKKRKKLYETIEVRLSLRIQEADLLNKCKFYKKKALKGYPLNFRIRVDGNPDEFMLAAEGILNKARMFLSDACTAPTNLMKSNTSISLCFNPLNKPHSSNRSSSPYERTRSERLNYTRKISTYNVSERSNMGKMDMDGIYNTPSSSSIFTDMPSSSQLVIDGHDSPNVANRPTISNTTNATAPDVSNPYNMASDSVVSPDTTKFDTPTLGSPDMNGIKTIAGSQSDVNPSFDSPMGIIQDTGESDGIHNLVELQQEQEKPSRFMTLNKKRECRWIVKHNKSDEFDSMGDSSGASSRSYTGTTGSTLITSSMANVSTIGTPGTIGYIRTAHNYSTYTFGNSNAYSTGPPLKHVNTGPESDIHASSKWKVLNKKNEY